MEEYTPLLARQIKRYLRSEVCLADVQDLLNAVNLSYKHYERDQSLAKRSIEISSAELRQLIAELSNKEEIFRQFSENSGDVYLMLSADLSEILYISPNFEKIYHLSLENASLSMRSWVELIHHSDRLKYLEGLEKVLKADSPIEIDYRIRMAGEKTIWIKDRLFPVKNDKDVVYRIGGVRRDITSQKLGGLRTGIRTGLHEILNRYNKIEEIVPKILESVCSTTGWKLGIYWQVDGEAKVARYLDSCSQSNAFDQFINLCSSFTFKEGEGLIGKMLADPKIQIIKDIQKDLSPPRASAALKAGIVDLVVFPVMTKDKIYGVIEFFNISIKYLDQSWTQLFLDFSNQMALFIERKNTEQALIASEERFRSVVEHAVIGIALISLDGFFLQVNPALCDMLGYSKEELLKTNLKEITYQEDWVKEATYRSQLLAKEMSSFQTEKRYYTKNKDIIWTLTSNSLVKDFQGSPLYFIYEVQDISQRKRTEEKLLNLAYYDYLTELPNKRLVEDTLNQAILTAFLKNEKIAVFFIKIEHFSHIKDAVNPATSDAILKQIALRLKDRIQIKEVVGRWGEDEFVIILSNITADESAKLFAKKILSTIKEPFIFEDRKFYFTASVGISLFPDHANQTQLLLRNGYIAMSRASSQGSENVEFYSEEMIKHAQEKMVLEARLPKAIVNNELSLSFQPVIDIEKDVVSSIEVLLGWYSKELGLVPSSKFIPIAEESGLIFSIGDWVIREACKALAMLKKKGIPSVIFSINLSVLQLKDEKFLDTLFANLKENQLQPSELRCEISDIQLMEASKETIEKLNLLREKKVHLSIDNFGIGRSYFFSLKELNWDYIKIDGSIIHNIHQDGKRPATVSAILAWSNVLGITTIADGVEKGEELQYLRRLGCKEFQGYYFSKPLSFEELIDFLNKKNAVKAIV